MPAILMPPKPPQDQRTPSDKGEGGAGWIVKNMGALDEYLRAAYEEDWNLANVSVKNYTLEALPPEPPCQHKWQSEPDGTGSFCSRLGCDAKAGLVPKFFPNIGGSLERRDARIADLEKKLGASYQEVTSLTETLDARDDRIAELERKRRNRDVVDEALMPNAHRAALAHIEALENDLFWAKERIRELEEALTLR